MKECLANMEGIECHYPVVGGGRCEYHQLPEFAKRHNRRRMKKTNPNNNYRYVRNKQLNKVNY